MANKPMKTINFGGEDTYYLNPNFENIDNSPFETIGGDTLTWDGNTDGLESLQIDEAEFYRVSNVIPTLSECANGCTLSYDDGSTSVVLGDFEIKSLMDDGSDAAYGAMPYMIIIPKTVTMGETTFLKGVWFYNHSDGYICSLTINGYTGFTITKLKSEYLPVDYIRQLIAEVTGN